jgi:hypothetical protein
MLLLFDNDFELRSNSFTFGNEYKLSFLSLNHDLLSVLNIDTLGRIGYQHALEGI